MAVREEAAAVSETVKLVARPRLTPREVQVLEGLAEGLSTKEIAARLYVSEQAVTYHIGNLLSKFGCENRAGVVSRAFVLSFLDPGTWPPRVQRNGPDQAGGRSSGDETTPAAS